MFKYLFLIFILIGCSNTDVSKKSNDSKTKEEKYLLLKGANLYSSGKISEALSIYEEILKINNKNIDALREKSVIEYKLGNIDNAEKDLIQVLTMNSKDNLALKNLGYLNFNKKNYNKSLEYLKHVSLDSRDDRYYFILGYIKYLDKKYKETLNYYEKIENDS
ncbi:MAG: tetratricopeptide repeat protein, partial [Cetobacterium sp.]